MTKNRASGKFVSQKHSSLLHFPARTFYNDGGLGRGEDTVATGHLGVIPGQAGHHLQT